MNISFQSTVIITSDFDTMKSFYRDVLMQEIALDFGTCVGFKNGLSLWQLQETYPIAQKLGRNFDKAGNKNMELCFETDDFDEVVQKLKSYTITFLHEVVEEAWGQRTIRFYDPENNLVEVGETIPCFVKRFHKQGMTVEEVSKRTSVPVEMVVEICK